MPKYKITSWYHDSGTGTSIDYANDKTEALDIIRYIFNEASGVLDFNVRIDDEPAVG